MRKYECENSNVNENENENGLLLHAFICIIKRTTSVNVGKHLLLLLISWFTLFVCVCVCLFILSFVVPSLNFGAGLLFISTPPIYYFSECSFSTCLKYGRVERVVCSFRAYFSVHLKLKSTIQPTNQPTDSTSYGNMLVVFNFRLCLFLFCAHCWNSK